MGTPQRFSWHPSPEEVESILVEMRPIIAELARHQNVPTGPLQEWLLVAS
jgi:hypothetical protein